MEESTMGNFLLGFGIGITVGVLFAPKAGSDTRQYLSDKANEGTDYLSQQGQQLKDSTNDLLAKGRKIVQDQKDKVADMASNVAGQAQREYQRQA
jgi:gas vesicle protein